MERDSERAQKLASSSAGGILGKVTRGALLDAGSRAGRWSMQLDPPSIREASTPTGTPERGAVTAPTRRRLGQGQARRGTVPMDTAPVQRFPQSFARSAL